MKNERDILRSLEASMTQLDRESVLSLVRHATATPVDYRLLMNSLTAGMQAIGDRFSRGECFLPQLVFCGQIFSDAMEILKPELKARGISAGAGKKVVIGTVQGDLHDLGIQLVSLVLRMGGFEVLNLGKDVSAGLFIQKVEEVRPHILGLSALLTTTLKRQQEVMRALETHDLRNDVKVMIGGAPVTQEWADTIGADGVGFDAFDALRKAEKLVGMAE